MKSISPCCVDKQGNDDTVGRVSIEAEKSKGEVKNNLRECLRQAMLKCVYEIKESNFPELGETMLFVLQYNNKGNETKQWLDFQAGYLYLYSGHKFLALVAPRLMQRTGVALRRVAVGRLMNDCATSE